MSDNSQNQPGQTDGAAASADAPAKKKYKAVTINRFGMSAPLPNSRGDVSSRAYWSSYRGNPRFVIQTNDPNDANNNFGKITAAMDLATFQELMTLLEMVADAAPGSDYSKVKIENKSSYQGDQRFETPQTINSTTIGKDEDGRVWISVVEGNRPTPRFFFGPTEYHNVIRRDGQPLTPAEASVHFAKATAKILPNIMAVLAARAALGDEPDEDKDATGGAAAGGGQRQGGWQGQRQGGGWQGNRGGGGGNWGNKGGGSWGNKGGGGGNWQGNRGNWQGNRGGNGGGGQWQGQRQGGGNSEAANTQAVAALSNNDITF